MHVLQAVWDFLGRNAASVIALCAFLFTAYGGFTTRKHNRLTVRPYLTSFVARRPIAKGGRTKVTWRLMNQGLGPAVVKSYSVFLDGERVDTGNHSACLKALVKAFGDIPNLASDSLMKKEERYCFSIANLASDHLMKKEESLNFLVVEFPTPSLDRLPKSSDIDEFDAGVRRFKIVIRYRSLYGEEFSYESDRE